MSNSFTVSAGPATQLEIAQYPITGVVGVPLAGPVVVLLLDRYSNTDAASGAPVTLASKPGGVSTTLNAQNGVATFNSLTFNAPGTYTLTVSSPGLTSLLTATVTITVGLPVTVSGNVTVSGHGLSGVTLNVTDMVTPSTSTDASGAYSLNLFADFTYFITPSLPGYVFNPSTVTITPSGNRVLNFTATSSTGPPACIGVFSDSSIITCSTMTQNFSQNNPAVIIGVPATFYGAMTLVGNAPAADAAGMALYNAGGGGGASVSLDLYNTSYNGGIPQAKIKAIDDGNYSDHLTFWTKNPGGQDNAVAERVRITSTGNVGSAQRALLSVPLQTGSGAYVSAGGGWANASDRNLKQNFTAVNPAAILLKIDALPLLERNYKNEDPSGRHTGPVAQDFYSSLGSVIPRHRIPPLIHLESLWPVFRALTKRAGRGPSNLPS